MAGGSVDAVCLDPSSEQYDHRKAHPERMDGKRGVLSGEEEGFFRRTGVSIFYMLDESERSRFRIKGLELRKATFPVFALSGFKETYAPIEGIPPGLSLLISETHHRGFFPALFHPRIYSSTELVLALEHLALQSLEEVKGKGGPIEVVVFDLGWTDVVNALKGKYGAKEYLFTMWPQKIA